MICLVKCLFQLREKVGDLTQSYDESPYTYRENSKKQRDNTKNFYYITAADQLSPSRTDGQLE